LDCLSGINGYLKKRATETSGILTKLFNSYSGEDYYFAEKAFADIRKIK